ncbi:unnamed protein product [Sympodiomycopsis kandeliae]
MGQGQSTTTYHPSAIGPQDVSGKDSSESSDVRFLPRRGAGISSKNYAGRNPNNRQPATTNGNSLEQVSTPAPPGHFPTSFGGPTPSNISPLGVARSPEPRPIADVTRSSPVDDFAELSPIQEHTLQSWRRPRPDANSYFAPDRPSQSTRKGWRPAGRDRTVSLSALSPSNLQPSPRFGSAVDPDQATAALRAIHRVSNPPSHADIPEMSEEGSDFEDAIVSTDETGGAPSPRRLSVPLAEALRMGLGRSASGSSHRASQDDRRSPDLPQTSDSKGQVPQNAASLIGKRETGETDRERLLAFWAQEDAEQTAQSQLGDRRSPSMKRRHSWSSGAADSSAEDARLRSSQQSDLKQMSTGGRIANDPSASQEILEDFEDPYEDTVIDTWGQLPELTSDQQTPLAESALNEAEQDWHGTERSAVAQHRLLPVHEHVSYGNGPHHREAQHSNAGLLRSSNAEQLHSELTQSNQSLMSAARASSSFELLKDSGNGKSAQSHSIARHGKEERTRAMAGLGLGNPPTMDEMRNQQLTTSRVPDPQFTSSSSDFEDSDVTRQAEEAQQMRHSSGSRPQPPRTSQQGSTMQSPPIYVSQLDSVLIPSPQSHNVTSEGHTRPASTGSDAYSSRASIGGRPPTNQTSPQNMPIIIPNGLVGIAPAGPVASMRNQKHQSMVTSSSSPRASHMYAPSQTSEADAIRLQEIEQLRAGPSFRRDEEEANHFQSAVILTARDFQSTISVTEQPSGPEKYGRSRASSLFTKIKSRVRKGSDAVLLKGSTLMPPPESPHGSQIIRSRPAGLPPVSSDSGTHSLIRNRQVSAPPPMTQASLDNDNHTTRDARMTGSGMLPREEVSAFSRGAPGGRGRAGVRRKPVQHAVGSLRRPPSISESLRSSRSGKSGPSLRSNKSGSSLRQTNRPNATMLPPSPRHRTIRDQDFGVIQDADRLLRGDTNRLTPAAGRSSVDMGRNIAIQDALLPPSSRMPRERSGFNGREGAWEDIQEESTDATAAAAASASHSSAVSSHSASHLPVKSTSAAPERERRKLSLGNVLGWPRRASKTQDLDLPAQEGSAVPLPAGTLAPSEKPLAVSNEHAVISPSSPALCNPIAAPDGTQEKPKVLSPNTEANLQTAASNPAAFSSLAPPPAPQPVPPKRPRRPRNRRTASDSQTGSQSEGGGTVPSPQSSRSRLRSKQASFSNSPAAPIWDESLPVGSTEATSRAVSSPHGTLATIQSSYYVKADDDAASRVISDGRGVTLSERGSVDGEHRNMLSPLSQGLALRPPLETSPSYPVHDASSPQAAEQMPQGADALRTSPTKESRSRKQIDGRSSSRRSLSFAGAALAHMPLQADDAQRVAVESPSSKRRPLPVLPSSGSSHARAASASFGSDLGLAYSPGAQSSTLAMQRNPAQSSTASFVKHPGEDELRARVRVPSQAESDLSVASARGRFSNNMSSVAASGQVARSRHHRGASDHLSAALETDDERHTLRGGSGHARNSSDDNTTQNAPASHSTVKRPLPIPPTSPTDTTAVASSAGKDIDGLPKSATSPTFKSMALNRTSWQSAEEPWKADVVFGTSASPARGYANATKSTLREARPGGEAKSTTHSPSKANRLRGRSSSEPLYPPQNRRTDASSADAPVPKGGVQASLAALKALETQIGDDEELASPSYPHTASRFLGSTQYSLPRSRRRTQASEDDVSDAIGGSRHSAHSRRRRQSHRRGQPSSSKRISRIPSQYDVTPDEISSVGSSRFRPRESRRRDRLRYQRERPYLYEPESRSRHSSRRGQERRLYRDYPNDRVRSARHRRDLSEMALASGTSLVESDLLTASSETLSESEWMETPAEPRARYEPIYVRRRPRATGSAPRIAVPSQARHMGNSRRSDRQYASELAPMSAEMLRAANLDPRSRPVVAHQDLMELEQVDDRSAAHLHYITPPRRVSRATAAALAGEQATTRKHQEAPATAFQSHSHRGSRRQDPSTSSSHLNPEGHQRFYTAVSGGTTTQEDWDETIVPALRRRMEEERRFEEEMVRQTETANAREASRTAGDVQGSEARGGVAGSPSHPSRYSVAFPSTTGRHEDDDDRRLRREELHINTARVGRHPQDASYDSGRAHHGHSHGHSRSHTHESHGGGHGGVYVDEYGRLIEPREVVSSRRRNRPSMHRRHDSTAVAAPLSSSKRSHKTSISTTHASKSRASKRGLEKQDILEWQKSLGVGGQ